MKSLFSKSFFDRNEGSLGNAKTGFIRKSHFLIREGWMDGWGATWKKRPFLLMKSLFCFERMVISSFGKYETPHFTEKVDFVTTDLKKKLKQKYEEQYFR